MAIPPQRAELLAVIEELCQRYPHWRLGQLVANVAGWADQEIWDVEDEQLLEAARLHLEQLMRLMPMASVEPSCESIHDRPLGFPRFNVLAGGPARGRLLALIPDVPRQDAMSTEITDDPWMVFDYEADMFDGMCALLQNGNAEYAVLSDRVRNAVVESALLHGRQLVDILLSRGGDQDDINLSKLLPGFEPSRLGELRTLYGSRSLVDSPCWTLNKRLAHPTTKRGESFDYSALLNQLAPLITAIVRELQERSGRTNPT